MLINRSKVGVVFGEQDGTKYEVQYNDFGDKWLVHTAYVSATSKKEAGDIVDNLIDIGEMPEADDSGFYISI